MTKQTVLGRVSQIARADLDALLDHAEDQYKMIDHLIRDHTDTIREAEDALAAELGELRRMEQDHAEDVAAAAEWGSKALAASRKADELRITGGFAAADRFDRLARIALGRQLRCEREARVAEPVLAAQAERVGELKAGVDRMKAQRGRLQARREELVSRSRSARWARNARMDLIKSVNLFDPTDDMGRFEDKVRREEARAQGREALPESSLDAQFESPDSLRGEAAEIEARLARLKTSA